MTKADLIEQLYESVESITKKQSGEYVETILDFLKESLIRGETVKISSFGNFVVHQKKERQGRNPQTGEPLVITGRRVVNFKASSVLKGKMN